MCGDYGRGPCIPVVMTMYEYVARSLLGISFIALKLLAFNKGSYGHYSYLWKPAKTYSLPFLLGEGSWAWHTGFFMENVHPQNKWSQSPLETSWALFLHSPNINKVWLFFFLGIWEQGKKWEDRILVMNSNMIVEMSSELSDTGTRDDFLKKKIPSQGFSSSQSFSNRVYCQRIAVWFQWLSLKYLCTKIKQRVGGVFWGVLPYFLQYLKHLLRSASI